MRLVKPSLQGQFLLAASSLDDSNFEQAVVLMVRHDGDGAMGVIVNRPLDVTVADALGETVESAIAIDQPLHQGGPCTGPMMVLHGDATIGGDLVLPGVRLTTARDDIEAVMARGVATPSRYLVGYAGWASDQLEREFAEGSWLVTPATIAETFGATADLWQKLASRATLAKFIRPGDLPRDANLN